MIEHLENRVLLTADFVNGLLTVNGTGAGETITLIVNGPNVTVTISSEGFNADYPIASVQSIVINAGGGSDSVSVDSLLTQPATINGDTGNDVIVCGSGDTYVVGGDGSDSIVGGSGNDTLYGDGDDPADVIGTIIPTTSSATAEDTISGGDGDDYIAGGSNKRSSNTAIVRTFGDLLSGELGNDTIIGGVGEDTMDGGDGIDLLSYAEKTGNVNIIFPEPANPFYWPPPNTPPAPAGGTVNDPEFQGQGTTQTRGPNPGVRVVTEYDVVAMETFEQFETGSGSDRVDVSLLEYAVTVMTNGGNDTILGNDFGNAVFAGAGNDDIFVGAGNDTIDGGDGSDVINTGDGNDSIIGGGGNDNIVSGTGEDTIDAGEGSDNVQGGEGNDSIDAGAGNDSVQGGDGNDTILGGDGNDTLHGDLVDFSDTVVVGDDLIDGGLGDDLVTGGGGNDTLLGGAAPDGADTLQGDDGIDTVDYSQRITGVTATLDTVHDDGGLGELDFVTETVEIVIGGAGDDRLESRGDGVPRTLMGGLGNDTLSSGSGPDVLDGGAGIDTVNYEQHTAGVNVSIDGVANDGEPGENDNVINVEVLIGGSGDDTLSGGTSGLGMTIDGGAGNDSITGTAHDDALIGGTGNDTLNGAAGDDSLIGGVGGDDLSGGDGFDTVDYSDRTTAVNISFDDVANDGEAGENDNLRSDVDAVLGGALDDLIDISGSTSGKSINGGAGDDTMIGSSYRDTLDGGDGNDSINGGGGGDVLYGGHGDDTIDGGLSSDRMVGGPGKDLLLGNNGNDTMQGAAGSDTIVGGHGNDWVSYYYDTRPVIVTLDGLPDDGVKGENDDVHFDVENIRGGRGNDILHGNSLNNIIWGGPGNDLINGYNGHDQLLGEAGSDTLNGGNQNDLLDGGSGPDRIIGGGGHDIADYSSRTENLRLSKNNLADDGALNEFDKIDYDVEELWGGSGNDSITGSHLPDTLSGMAGNDTLRGGGANDSLDGGLGSDSLFGDAGDDTITANDGVADFIDGGSGFDTILQDVGLDIVTNVP